MQTDKKRDLFEKSPVPKAVLSLAIPTILSQLVTLIYNLADTYFVGQTGDKNMVAAVSLCVITSMIMIAVINLFGVGGGSFMARMLGLKREDTAKRASAFCIFGSGAVALVLSVIMLFAMEPLLYLCGASADTIGYSKQYVFWTFVIGAVPTVMSGVMAQTIRADGNAMQSGLGLTFGAVLNIILDPIFIVAFNMGVRGVAIATMLSNVCIVCYFIVLLKVSKKPITATLNIKFAKLSKEETKPIFTIGLPAAINSAMVSVAVGVMNGLASDYGDTIVAAIGVIKKVDLVPWCLILGLTQGVLPLLSYNFAQKNLVRFKKVLGFTILTALSINVACIAVFESLPYQVIGIFINDADVVSYGGDFLRTFCISVPFMSVGYILNTSFQAMGKGLPALFLSIYRQGIVFISALYIMESLMGLYGIILAQVISDAIFAFTAGVMLFFIFRRVLKQSKRQAEPHIDSVSA